MGREDDSSGDQSSEQAFARVDEGVRQLMRLHARQRRAWVTWRLVSIGGHRVAAACWGARWVCRSKLGWLCVVVGFIAAVLVVRRVFLPR